VRWYVRQARESGGPVLEYGVGNGRVAIPTIRAGIHVVGIDLSRPMLDDLRARAAHEPPHVRARLELVQADMREACLGRRFPLVIAPFNVILHLYRREDLERFFAGVREHLEPEGRFLFDFSLPQPSDLARSPRRSYPAPAFQHPATGIVTRYSERFEYDPLRQLMLVWMRFEPADGEPCTVPLTHRQFFPAEMEALLHYNGFSEIEFTADFADQPPAADADSLVVSCRLAGSRARA
jgi:SAM-dependent methyltransferase